MKTQHEDWKMILATQSCRLTPVQKRWYQGKDRSLCILFPDGNAEPHTLMVEKEKGYVYAILDEDEAIIVDYEAESEQLIIPGMIAGRSVLAVSGFKYREDIKKVTIEEGILQICYNVFDFCSGLECVELPGTLVRIAGEFCDRSSRLYEFKVKEKSHAFSTEEGVLFDLHKRTLVRYPAARQGACYQIPDSVRLICPNAFAGGDNLKKILVSNGIEKIGMYAFASCRAEEIVLPDTLKEIENRAFFMSNIPQIYIPDSVERIGERAFGYCSCLVDVRLPKYLSELGEYVFQECHALFKVKLSEGIQKLEGTFYECWDLEHVYIPSTVIEIIDSTFAQDNRDAKGPGMEVLTIHGEKGSYIEKYASEKEHKFSEGLWDDTVRSHWVQEEMSFDDLKNAEEGDTVTFGKYLLQRHRGKNDPVLWRVLKKDNKKLLLLSEYCLRYEHFDKNGYELWENSMIRRWLNTEFADSCFSKAEKDVILETVNLNMDSNRKESDSVQSTKDIVFCLSADEVEAMLPEARHRKARLTPAARACCGREGSVEWWLRTEGNMYSTMYIWPEGFIETNGKYSNETMGVRPAVWLDLDKIV